MLATPVQYEPALEQLNEARPLILPDEVKQEISIAVGCVNLPTVGRPAVGKMLRCDSQGALTVKNGTEVFSKYIAYGDCDEENDIFESFTFLSIPKGVLTYVRELTYPAEKLYWCNSDEVLLLDLGSEVYKWMPYRGGKFYYSSNKLKITFDLLLLALY